MDMIKSAIFYPMIWIRKPIIIVLKAIGGLCFIGILVALFAFRDTDVFWKILISYTVLSFGCFMLAHFYDRILLWLNPTRNALLLKQ